MGQKASRVRKENNRDAKNRPLYTKGIEETLMELQTRAIQQYPWLANGYQSCVVTDCSLPDNPLVWVNDDFERMTLYSKEEILNKNCRFLQGKCTNPQTVASIKDACKNGKELEVEILNYRKDGVAFWNKFRILPIFGNSNMFGKSETKVVTHFIAIQEDVTYLKEAGNDPELWTPPETGMWLDHIDLGDYSKVFLDNNIGGLELMELTKANLINDLNMRSKDADHLLKKVSFLKTSPKAAFQRSDSSYSSDNELTPSEKQQLSNQRRMEERVAVKCYKDEDIRLFLVKKNSTLADFKKVVKRSYGALYNVQLKNEEKATTSQDFSYALETSEGATIRVDLIKSENQMKSSEKKLLEEFCDGVVATGRDGTIVFANKAALKLFDYTMDEIEDENIKLLIPKIDLAVGAKRYTAHKKDMKMLQVRASVSSSKKGMYLLTINATSE